MPKKKKIVSPFPQEVLDVLPINYQLMEKSDSSFFIVPIESKFHKDKMYRSYQFYKPISKIFSSDKVND